MYVQIGDNPLGFWTSILQDEIYILYQRQLYVPIFPQTEYMVSEMITCVYIHRSLAEIVFKQYRPVVTWNCSHCKER